MNKSIIFLIRRRLKLKKWQPFKFDNQKNKAVYCFGNKTLVKVMPDGNVIVSDVSLNWLLDDNCKITKLNKVTKTIFNTFTKLITENNL